MVEIKKAEELVSHWGKTVGAEFEIGKLELGERLLVGSLLFTYNSSEKSLWAMGMLYPTASDLLDAPATMQELEHYADRHPNLTGGAEIVFLQKERGDTSRIVLRKRFFEPPNNSQFITSLKELSANAYEWRVRYLADAIYGNQ